MDGSGARGFGGRGRKRDGLFDLHKGLIPVRIASTEPLGNGGGVPGMDYLMVQTLPRLGTTTTLTPAGRSRRRVPR
jgi:hypothetical protein